MAKIILIVPPLTGHINPTVALGQVLTQRGHDVSWLGFDEPLRSSLPQGCRVCPLIEVKTSEDKDASEIRHGQQERRGFAGLHFLWEHVLVPLARQTYSQVHDILIQEDPDLCVVDQQMFSGALACQTLGIPYLTSSTTSAALIDALEGLPQVAAWSQGLLASLWREQGLEVTHPQLDLSSRGVLAFSSQHLALSATPHATLPNHVHCVGPALEGNRAPIDFPWERLDPTLPRVFFSMGTVNAERATKLYARVIEALSDAPLQLIAAAPPEAFTDAPAHWIVQRRVPQLSLLAEVDAVFCHGGHNTTVEALSFGLPLIVAPIRDDQPVIAEQIRAVGAGIRIHFARSKPRVIRAAVDEILNNPKYREAALAVRHEFMGDAFMNHPSSQQRRPIKIASSLGATRAAQVVEVHLASILEE